MRFLKPFSALLSLLAFAPLCSASSLAEPLPFRYDLPSTGVLPSYYSAEYSSPLRERHGGASSLSFSRFSMAVPFSDPRRSGYRDWAFNASLDAQATFMDVEGALDLKRQELWNFLLPLSLIHDDAQSNRLILTLAPSVASDFSHWNHAWDVFGLATYTMKLSETFSLGVGVAAAPRFFDHYAAPYLSFTWKPTENWNIALNGYRLSALYSLTPRWALGPVAEAIVGSWAVHTDEGSRLFRFRSLMLGMRAEYDFAEAGQRKRVLRIGLGSLVSSHVQFCSFTASHAAEAMRHYHPSFYATLAADFRF